MNLKDMNLRSIIEQNKYSSNIGVNEYIKKLDKLSLSLDGSSLASITSFKFMLLQNKDFFNDIDLLKFKKVNGFENFEIDTKSRTYNIFNYGIDLQRYLLSNQISLLNLDKKDENSIKYINNIFNLSKLFSSENWERHFLSTIISATLYDIIKNSKNKTEILETFSQNVIFFESIEKLYYEDKQKFAKIYSDLLSIPIKNSYCYLIKNNTNDKEELNKVSQQNKFKNITEASYPYLFLNFSSFFNINLKNEYFNKLNIERINQIKKEYEITKSSKLLAELSELSKKII